MTEPLAVTAEEYEKLFPDRVARLRRALRRSARQLSKRQTLHCAGRKLIKFDIRAQEYDLIFGKGAARKLVGQ